MLESLADLEQRRAELVRELSNLQDLRPGSISGIVRRRGKPTCHCAQTDQLSTEQIQEIPQPMLQRRLPVR